MSCLGVPGNLDMPVDHLGWTGSTGFVVPKTLNLQPNMPSGVGTLIDRAASLQPARAPKQQIPLEPCKGRGRLPAHEEDRVCLPSGSVGSILGKATSTTDYWNTVNQTNKQTNKQTRRLAQYTLWLAHLHALTPLSSWCAPTPEHALPIPEAVLCPREPQPHLV